MKMGKPSTLESALKESPLARINTSTMFEFESRLRDSNPGPPLYESGALPLS
jgi:hypothetical protein